MSSGFITEAEIAERRRVRQEEWEKVRKPDEPIEAPEEEYDGRSLYERLQANKQKRDLEYEEAHRLKNMIKGLDDDEVEFLDLVDRSKLEEERRKCLEEAREMAEFRSKVACLQEASLNERIQLEIQRSSQSLSTQPAPVTSNPSHSSRSSQSKLLAGAVVKKRSSDSSGDPSPSPAKRPKQTTSTSSETRDEDSGATRGQSPEVNHSDKSTESAKESITTAHSGSCNHMKVGGMTCIGVLPGLGHYRTESSDEMDSDESSDLEDPESPVKVAKFDLVGRKIKKKSSAETD